MALSKKERRLTIWIGISIGVACSSMLVRYALKQKEYKAQQRPGNYASGMTASNAKKFPPLPVSVTRNIPNGIVVFHELNKSIEESTELSNQWILETSGSFRSERLFILVEEDQNSTQEPKYFRASEIYVRMRPEKEKKDLELILNNEVHKIIGFNRKSEEYIVQIKEIDPSSIRANLNYFREKSSLIANARIIPWVP